ncbi:hypothetical protein LEP1GSC017_1177 [Leptospira meyeri serovar Hardjo str. Went 5]|nr:hypothetical protein LEP1GSC017_1177 [Leptospira meyeri serovar Hardjo str. Went 5]
MLPPDWQMPNQGAFGILLIPGGFKSILRMLVLIFNKNKAFLDFLYLRNHLSDFCLGFLFKKVHSL